MTTLSKIDAEILRRERARVILKLEIIELKIWAFGGISVTMIALILILWAIGTS